MKGDRDAERCKGRVREREKKMEYKEATGACKASKSIIVVVDWKLD